MMTVRSYPTRRNRTQPTAVAVQLVPGLCLILPTRRNQIHPTPRKPTNIHFSNALAYPTRKLKRIELASADTRSMAGGFGGVAAILKNAEDLAKGGAITKSDPARC